ncbi:MAG: lauroyl acyltransferase [Pseudoxanthomonas sp.]|nr:lauroyl acyltransferase [Pseudoxanthomonas sp.]
MKPETTAGLLYRAAALLTSLPWPWLRGVADGLAWAWRRLDARESQVARRNLQLAYPELLPSQREELHRRVLRTTARQALETLRFWTHPHADNLRCVQAIHGQAHFDEALAAGKGLIVAAPHFGNWELLNQWLSSRGPIAIVYAPPDSPVGDAFLLRVRSADNIRQVRAEGAAVRRLWKVLKDGGVTGILPDQQPKLGDGVFAPFFGVQALTMTLVSRLAERTGATVLFAWCERSGPDLAFELHLQPAPAAIADPEPVVAATALNAMVEHIARRDPAQYQWTYKRYTLRPAGSGEPNPYQPATRTEPVT